VLASGIYKDRSYLILEYIAPGNPASTFWSQFAENLAKLHHTTQPHFGLDHDNYIGSLPQSNKMEITASEFYINQRLEPQLKRARDSGFSFSNLDRFFTTISEVIPNEVPSLIHGDLWNGNFLISEKGDAALIDPAVAFAPREMDLAMMQLFGGFPSEVFSMYNEHFSLTENWKERTSLWQLYYLLVHLNLFGAGYLLQVNAILKKYS
jgi:Fructosamine-3-kinase